MGFLRVVVGVFLLLSFSFATDGVAQSREARERARVAYRKAVQSYDFGEYQKALDGFKLAYAEVEDPAILFNIAQCHRQLGQRAEAVRVYKSYLRNANGAPNAVEVRAVVERLEKSIADEQAIKNAPPQPVEASTANAPPSDNKPVLTVAPAEPAPVIVATKKPIHKRWYFWVGLVGGVVVVGAAAGLAVAFTTPNNASYPPGTREVRF